MDNENIELLRLRSFTVSKALSDAEIMDSNAQEKIASLFGVMEPFVSSPLMSRVIHLASLSVCPRVYWD